MDVLVTDNIHGPETDSLCQQWDVVLEPDLWQQQDRLREQVATARAWIVRNQTRGTAEWLAASRSL